MKPRSLLLCLLFTAATAPLFADTPHNAVTDWAALVRPAIHSAAAPRPAGSAQVLHTMAVLAMYNAVVAIEGGYEPYAAHIRPRPGADVRAAVATAAYLTARARVAPSRTAYLDHQYAAYLAGIADGRSKTEGIDVGVAAATGMLDLRANDGFANAVLYQCRTVPPSPGEFEPDAGCPAHPGAPQPVDANLGQVRPFTFSSTSTRVLVAGPIMANCFLRRRLR